MLNLGVTKLFMQKNILFVCSANKQRSKTVEDYFSLTHPEHNYSSAGTNLKICAKEGTNPLTIELLQEADLVFVMENRHKKLIKESLKDQFKKEIIVLEIPDIYKYYQKELIELLEVKMKSYF